MMRPDAKVQKVYLYPKPVDFRKSINGLAALVELDIKAARPPGRHQRVPDPLRGKRFINPTSRC